MLDKFYCNELIGRMKMIMTNSFYINEKKHYLKSTFIVTLDLLENEEDFSYASVHIFFSGDQPVNTLSYDHQLHELFGALEG